MHENGEQEPPCLVCLTRWNSALIMCGRNIMYQRSLKLIDVLICISDKAIANEFVDHSLSIEDWSHIQSMFVPAKICNYINGSTY